MSITLLFRGAGSQYKSAGPASSPAVILAQNSNHNTKYSLRIAIIQETINIYKV